MFILFLGRAEIPTNSPLLNTLPAKTKLRTRWLFLQLGNNKVKVSLSPMESTVMLEELTSVLKWCRPMLSRVIGPTPCWFDMSHIERTRIAYDGKVVSWCNHTKLEVGEFSIGWCLLMRFFSLMDMAEPKWRSTHYTRISIWPGSFKSRMMVPDNHDSCKVCWAIHSNSMPRHTRIFSSPTPRQSRYRRHAPFRLLRRIWVFV